MLAGGFGGAGGGFGGVGGGLEGLPPAHGVRLLAGLSVDHPQLCCCSCVLLLAVA